VQERNVTLRKNKQPNVVQIEKGLIEACISHLVDYRESISMCLSAFGASKEEDDRFKELDKTINNLKQFTRAGVKND